VIAFAMSNHFCFCCLWYEHGRQLFSGLLSNGLLPCLNPRVFCVEYLSYNLFRVFWHIHINSHLNSLLLYSSSDEILQF